MALMVFGLLLCGRPRLQHGTRRGILETREDPAGSLEVKKNLTKGLEARGDPVRDLEDGEGLDRGWKPEGTRPEDWEVQKIPLGA